MATYAELYALVAKPLFRERIQFAFWVKCLAVALDAGATQQQKQYAKRKLKGGADIEEIGQLAIRCASTPGIAAVGEQATDAQIQAVVDVAFADLVV